MTVFRFSDIYLELLLNYRIIILYMYMCGRIRRPKRSHQVVYPHKLVFPLCSQSAGAVALVHDDQLGPACDRQLQWPLLRNCAALPHAPVCHRFHRRLPLEDESRFGRHHVCAVLCLPRPQHPAREASHHLPRVHLITEEQ